MQLLEKDLVLRVTLALNLRLEDGVGLEVTEGHSCG